MPRLARSVFAQVPHHITQRGNRRDPVFFDDEDRHAYLNWLSEYASKNEVEVLAYCLMTNHIHLVAVPRTEDSLQQTLKPLHMRYAQHINRSHGWKGHLWQGRFFSTPCMKPNFGRQFSMSSAIRCVLEWCARRRTIPGPVRKHTVGRGKIRS